MISHSSPHSECSHRNLATQPTSWPLHPGSPGPTEHNRASPSLTESHRASPSLTGPHRVPSNLTGPQQISLSPTEPNRAPPCHTSPTEHHRASPSQPALEGIQSSICLPRSMRTPATCSGTCELQATCREGGQGMQYAHCAVRAARGNRGGYGWPWPAPAQRWRWRLWQAVVEAGGGTGGGVSGERQPAVSVSGRLSPVRSEVSRPHRFVRWTTGGLCVVWSSWAGTRTQDGPTGGPTRDSCQRQTHNVAGTTVAAAAAAAEAEGKHTKSFAGT